MKRFHLALAAVLASAATLGGAWAQTPAFPDVPQGHWAEEAVERLGELGVLTGYPDGRYRGEEPVSRYQLAVVLYRLYTLLSESLNGLSGPIPEAVEALKKADRALKALEALEAGEDLRELQALLGPALDRLALLERAVAEMGERLGAFSSFTDALTVALQNTTEETLAVRKELDALSAVLTQVVGQREFTESMERLARALVTLEGQVKALEARVTALERAGEEIKSRLEAPPPFTLKAYAKARASLGTKAPRLLQSPLETYPLALGVRVERPEGAEEARLNLGETVLLQMAQEGKDTRLGVRLLDLSDPSLALEGAVWLDQVALRASAWHAPEARGFVLEGEASQGRLRTLGKEGDLGERGRLLGLSPLNPGRGFGLEGGLRLEPIGLEGFYEQAEKAAYGLSFSLKPVEQLVLFARYTEVEDGNTQAVLKEGSREAGFSLAALLTAPWATVQVGYEWLRNAQGLLLQGDLRLEGVRLFGLYRPSVNALKAAGSLEGNLGALKLSLEAAHARATALWEAYLRGEVGARLDEVYLGLTYTEAASLGGLSPTLWDRRYDPLYPGLFEGEGPSLGSALQEAGLHLVYGPLSFTYGLLLRPVLGDRFLVSYRWQLP